MKPVRVEEVLNLKDYEKSRTDLRGRVLKQKESRRIHLGKYFTFLFENHDTILYQIQEMLRTEHTENPEAIQHEVHTYNELIGEKGELGCTLLIEIEDPKERDLHLTKMQDVFSHLFIRTQSGRKVSALFDQRQISERRVSSVQYLKFKVGDQVPEALVCDHPDYKAETRLNVEQTKALCTDLI